MKLLITGGTGFIGKRLTEKLLQDGHEIFVLVRSGSLKKAKTIFPEKGNVHFVLGDISNNDVLDTLGGIEKLPADIEGVIHLAAHYDLEVGLSSAYSNNVVGTQNVIYLMQRMRNLKFYHHISTYAVSGLYDGEFQEEQLDTGDFPDNYSRTKMQAEYLVRHARMNDVKVRIYRPGIVIGDSKSGEMDKIDGPYYFLRLFSQLADYKNLIPFPYLPISCHAGSQLPLLPVDVLVEWLHHMILNPTQHKIRTYHLIPEEKILITDFVQRALDYYGLKLKVLRIPFPQIYGKALPLLKIPKELVPYMQSKTTYSKKQINEDFPNLTAPVTSHYLQHIFRRAKEMF
ncbi:MAG: SDR family oxidoreductase [Bacteriovoracia bacterium]